MVSVYWMVPVVHIERSCVNTWMMVVVVGEFSSVQEICPIILSIGRVHSEVRFEPLIVGLYLPLCFGVICC